MRLIKADCLGYKRLYNSGWVDLDPDVVCIVGPNAAGKSSFLNALTHLNDDRAFEPQERTRKNRGRGLVQVRALFVLEPDDRALIADIPEAVALRQVTFFKKNDYAPSLEFEPAIHRDMRPRRDVEARVRKLQAMKWAGERDSEGEETETPNADAIENALAVLASADERLTEDELAPIVALESLVTAADDLPHASRGLPRRLEELLAHERGPHPRDRVRAALRPRMPKFMKFGEEERALEPTYDLTGEGGSAIINLLLLAGTSYEHARAVAREGDKGRKKVFLDRANRALNEAFTEAWGQNNILNVSLDLDGTLLTVLMSMQAEDFLEIDQQSDGLRQFVALRSYIALAGEDVPPILLIDEAETHLHYDAQADLVQVLEEQEEAAKVIYTTHSAGCLPRDLGTAIRAIVPIEKEEHGQRFQTDDSHVINKFWTEGRGYSPLLIAMGAGAFAFSATQRAVIGEGMSETLLLPSLLREATGKSRLDYQVAPHFAEASQAEIADLDLVAARVVFLSDGDKGGSDGGKKLRRSGSNEQQIIYLGGRKSGLSLEDLLVKEVYLNAVNAELERWHPGVRFPADQLPSKSRSGAVAAWCASQKGTNAKPIELSKIDIAQRVLDQRRARHLVAPRRKQVLMGLDKEITAAERRTSGDDTRGVLPRRAPPRLGPWSGFPTIS